MLNRNQVGRQLIIFISSMIYRIWILHPEYLKKEEEGVLKNMF